MPLQSGIKHDNKTANFTTLTLKIKLINFVLHQIGEQFPQCIGPIAVRFLACLVRRFQKFIQHFLGLNRILVNYKTLIILSGFDLGVYEINAEGIHRFFSGIDDDRSEFAFLDWDKSLGSVSSADALGAVRSAQDRSGC